MKKSVIALVAAMTMATGVNATQDQANDNGFGIGAIDESEMTAIGVGALILGGIIANNRSDGGGEGPTPPPLEPTCEGSDPLVDGVCVGTTNTLTNTVTVSGTQTITQTITVPVTFTYAPTLQ
ncbi:hypothetical protein KUL42_38540 [Alteromonas sp. KUL42]|uniref:hypothetical protein n=1 Tax=Alteromonas sp. KUL42 TaxID=2480797 RepID=UPI0010367889|nr:hypothetical protein [Alteromonas sp. KUL42]TAP31954.1 hypothetical protein EYR97_19055 [Alteromonas sp. KUL42]GEA09093.1 hypothetical protein KUL42_38540 [Alteromonas sp. KUL42]